MIKPMVALFVISTGDGFKVIDLSFPASILLFFVHDLVMLIVATIDLSNALIMACQVFSWQFEILYKSFLWGMAGVKL